MHATVQRFVDLLGCAHASNDELLRLHARERDHLAPLLGLVEMSLPKSAGEPAIGVAPIVASRALIVDQS